MESNTGHSAFDLCNNSIKSIRCFDFFMENSFLVKNSSSLQNQSSNTGQDYPWPNQTQYFYNGENSKWGENHFGYNCDSISPSRQISAQDKVNYCECCRSTSQINENGLIKQVDSSNLEICKSDFEKINGSDEESLMANFSGNYHENLSAKGKN